MDFEFHYTKEQEEFRKEVRAFIEENAYKDPIVPPDPVMMSAEMFTYSRDMDKKMGKKGWFAPAYPKEYGGGGLDLDHCIILAEEFAKIQEEHRWPGGSQVSPIMTNGIMSQGTEEQKRKFLPRILNGEWFGFQCFTEPDAGSDEASMKSTAVLDGDDYVINGDKVFVGQQPDGLRPEFLYWPAVTDPDGARRENISAFFIPADLPGITYIPLDLIAAEGKKWEVLCEDVRCPADHLIGEKNKGWLVTQATLHVEHGGGGSLVPRNKRVLHILDYCKKTLRNGKPLSSDPMIQDLLVQIYLEYNVGRLWGLRNFAMTRGQIPMLRHTGTQTSLHRKRFGPVLGLALMDMLGPYSLIDDPELQVLMGEVVNEVRLADVTHIGGTPEVQQIMMSRALGLGRGSGRAQASGSKK